MFNYTFIFFNKYFHFFNSGCYTGITSNLIKCSLFPINQLMIHIYESFSEKKEKNN